MVDVFKQFDAYSLKARVFPVLISGLPVLAFLLVLVPWDQLGLPHAILASVIFVLLFAFADLARSLGKGVQARLGTGATPEQWHRGNSDVAEAAKDRYRAFVAQQLGRAAPSAEEEQTDPRSANDFYVSAGNWLREHTRDTHKFSILFNENITYGFRRNLLGLKKSALGINGCIALLGSTIIWLKPPYFVTLPYIEEKMVTVLVAVLLHSIYLLLAVNDTGVREASRIYGRQLILSCEMLIKNKTASLSSSASRKKNVGS